MELEAIIHHPQSMAHSSHGPLFETDKAKGGLIYKLFAASIFLGIISIWIYRATQAGEHGRLGWFGMFGAELWFGFYWVLTQAHRWNRLHRRTFKDRLSQRYEDDLPGVDIFVCTADPKIEPPMMVINTVLSAMAYDYPPEKLSVYLSDDGGSDVTFYALLEASRFAAHWIPYCKRFEIEPRSPAAHFRSVCDQLDESHAQHLASIKELYQVMENRVELVSRLGKISKSAPLQHKGFSAWDSFVSKSDHDTILQILIHSRDSEAKDIEGCRLPTLVYLAREKRPEHFHNYKAGAMNALIRVSSEISNGPVILNVDCDMYSNNSQSIRDALCFFLDEDNGHEIAFVQFPQNFHNLTKNDLYGASMRVISDIEFPGLDGFGGPLYIGTGCFHRRDTLCGRKFTSDATFEWRRSAVSTTSVLQLEERTKELASCTFEENTGWGKEVGLKYGFPVEDVMTGLSIQCRGWKSAYLNPRRKAFLGVAGTTLEQMLVQHKRWSEGDLQIILSTSSPIWYGVGKIKLGLIMGYSVYCLWALDCLGALYYSFVPALHLLTGVHLFPPISSMWVFPFAYVAIAWTAYSLCEHLWCGGTVLGWWNEQRMWLYKRTSCYPFAVVDTFLKLVGYAESGFVISAKVSDDDVSSRYAREKMEFGATSPMFVMLSSLAIINLLCLLWVLVKIARLEFVLEHMVLQVLLCGVSVLINLPLYDAAFIRKDKGRIPNPVIVRSILLALSVCTCYAFL